MKLVGLAVGLAGLLAASGVAQAQESLSCRVQKALASGAKARDFIWSEAHGASEPTGPVATRLGKLYYRTGQRTTQWGPMPNDTLTLNGKPLRVPPGVNGSIRFGKVIDDGKHLVIAYLAERENDSGATPSQIVLQLDATGAVVQSDIRPGSEEPSAAHCTVVE